ncbi:MAG: hypothetical protein KA087_01220 [Candidatus Saccharicenans sp.]|nr:hypothetical protein [Candidatus Saccharicenans sp.]
MDGLKKLQFKETPFVVLTRHFFRRLFLNETVFFEEQMAAKVISIIAFLAVFPAYIANYLLFPYLILPEKPQAWVEISEMTTLSMLLLGLITIFVWDMIFLDRQDFLNLMPLPLKPLTVFSAKFASLVMFVGLFAIGINSLSSIVFTILLGQARYYGLFSVFLLFLSYLLVMFLAGAFIFFALGFIAGFFNMLLRGKIFQRISDLLRFGLIVAHIFILYFFLIDTHFIQKQFESFKALQESPTTLMINFPPLWFTGLYEVLQGNRQPFFEQLAWRAILALVLAVAAFFLITLVSYSRHLKKTSPEGAKHYRPSIVRRLAEPVLNLTILRQPAERAVFWFYSSALTRSRLHRTRILSYLGVGFGVSLIMFVSTGKFFWKAQAGNMLSLPLVLSFFLVLGIRDATNIPLNLEANWIFEMTESPRRWSYFSALRKSIFVFALIPLYLLLFVFYGFIWNWTTSGVHGLYDLALAVLLVEGLFFQHRKFPFACSYLPGKSKLYIFWLVYVLLFLGYIFIPRWIEPYFLARPSRLIGFYGVIILIIAGLWLYHRYFFYEKNQILYEDNPEPALLELFHAT